MSNERGTSATLPETEMKQEQASFILVRGMEDLPDTLNQMAGYLLGTEVFNPYWYNPQETVEEKLIRLGQVVDQAKNQEKQVVLVGISAGAALAMAFMLQRPKSIRHLYSLSGVLDPTNQSSPELDHLKKNKTLREVIEYLDGNLNQGTITRLHLADRITAYYSPGDKKVPSSIASPDWVGKKKRMGSSGHITTIVRTLIEETRQEVKTVSTASFD